MWIQPAKGVMGSPDTPGSMTKSAPAWGCSASWPGLRPSRALVTKSWSSPGPPKAQLVIRAAGSSTVRSSLPRGREATDRPAVVEGHPQAALGVDGHAVGQAERALEVDERPASARAAAGEVEVEDVHAVRGRVDVVHALAIGTPLDAVGDGRGCGDRGDLPVGGDAVEGARVGPCVEGHGAAPQATCAVGLHVVEPGGPVIRLDRGQQAEVAIVGVGQVDTVLQAQRQPAGCPRQHRAGHLLERARPGLARGRVQPVDAPAGDVGPEQRATCGLPGRSLADEVARLEGDPRCGRHVSPPSAAGPGLRAAGTRRARRSRRCASGP